MPKIRSPLFSFLAKGRLGKSTSYRDGPSGPQAIATPTHPDANTPSQQTQRTKFALGRDWWYDLTPEGKDYFTDPFKALFTPFAAWLKYWLNALVVPHAPQHITTTGDDPLYTDPLITQTNLGQLVDGGETDLHTHAAGGVGVPPTPPFKSGRYYSVLGVSTGPATTATVADEIRAFPFQVPATTTFDRIAIYILTAVAGNVRLGVYADNGGTPEGGALLLDSGELSTSSTGLKQATINLTLQPGWCWLCHLPSAAPSSLSITAAQTLAVLGTTIPSTAAPASRARVAQAYGALPNPFPASPTLETGVVHLVHLRKA